MEDFANFKVPQFNGFDDDESVEAYFDVDLDQINENQESNSESSDNYQSFSVTESGNGPIYSLRKSMSSSNMVFEQEIERKLELDFKVNKVSRCDAHLEFLKKRNETKYCSTAEQVANFWYQPDNRFSSKPSKITSSKPKPTIPHPPQLRVESRCRSTTTISREELEEQKLLEVQKHYPKAHPLNRNIFLTPKAPEVSVKRTTVVKPFNLTQTKLKSKEAPQEAFKFQACPVPKWVISGPKLRVPFKPRGMTKKVEKKISARPQVVEEKRPTRIEPFSFDEKDKQLAKKKEVFIKKVIQDEKNAREFKATKILPAVLNNFTKSASSSVKSAKSEDALNGLISKPFKAAAPSVLYQEPFIPKRANKKTVPMEPQLNTTTRAKEREEFEKRRKEKEEMEEQIRETRAKEQKKQEELDIQRLRKQAEFRANPVRHFKELPQCHPGKFTIPASPNVVKHKSNKENCL